MCLDELNRFSESAELRTLKEKLKGFNVFEEIGVQRKELFHSRMLRFLLDANERHGLGDRFLKAFLRKFLPDNDGVLGVDLNGAVAHRELGRIDILVDSKEAKVVVAIENKIDSDEHGNQLVMYQQWVNENYPDPARKIFVFLTPEGDEASDVNWCNVSYTAVVDCVQAIINEMAGDANLRVRQSLEQYLDVLRRHIVPNSDIAKECLTIYHKHRKALDLIFEHIADRRMEVKGIVEAYINELANENFTLGNNSIKYIKFAYVPWDEGYRQRHNNAGCANTRDILLFAFTNERKRLSLQLLFSPATAAPSAAEQFRQDVFRIFNPAGQLEPRSHKSVASVTLLDEDDYEKPPDELSQTLMERLDAAFAETGHVWSTINRVDTGLLQGAGGGGA